MEEGGEVPEHELEALHEKFSAYVRHMEATDSHLDRLVRAGLVRRVSISAGGDGVVPSRSLDEIRVADVIAVFVAMGEVELRKRPIELAVEEFVATFRNAGFEAIGDTSFLDVVRGLPAPTETP